MTPEKSQCVDTKPCVPWMGSVCVLSLLTILIEGKCIDLIWQIHPNCQKHQIYMQRQTPEQDEINPKQVKYWRWGPCSFFSYTTTSQRLISCRHVVECVCSYLCICLYVLRKQIAPLSLCSKPPEKFSRAFIWLTLLWWGFALRGAMRGAVVLNNNTKIILKDTVTAASPNCTFNIISQEIRYTRTANILLLLQCSRLFLC